MKRYITNIFAVLSAALLAPSCSTDGVDNIPEGQGLITMNVETGTRAAGDAVDLHQCKVGVYDIGQEGALVRKYTGNCPEKIALVAGNYRVKVQYGQKPAPASFKDCYYEGKSQDIALEAGEAETAEVVCLPQSLAVEVNFAHDFNTLFDSYAADVMLEGVENGLLHYTENKTGYFTLPEGVTQMTWTFAGEHKTKGAISKTATFGVEMGKKYVLSLKFSPDMPGYIGAEMITLEIGSSVDWDDEFNFSNDPEITGPNNNFFFEPQVYADAAMNIRVDAQAAITKLSVEVAGQTYDLMNLAGDKVTVAFNDTRMGATITLNPSFFDFACGDTAVTFKVEDEDGGQAEKTATIRMEEGIMPVAEADCNLWSNSVVLRAKSKDSAPVIKMRRAGDSEWQTATATAAADGDHYAATFAPQWQSSQNAGNNNIYTPMAGTGVWAANTYEVRAEFDGKVSITSFTTQAGDVIPNAGLDEWSTWEVVGSLLTGGKVPYPNKDASTAFWVGGNNAATDALCTGVEVEGSHGKCAQLKPAVAVGVFAAGNLFTGSFDAGTDISDTYGNARFGVKYAFTGRPRALRFRCKINVAEATTTGDKLPSGAIDPARIFCCVVDWTDRHAVKSGLQMDESTFWNPVTSTALNEGKILGYADTGLITESNDWKTVEIPFVWYDKESKPTEGNYTMLISCSTSGYGDYTVGSTNNRIWIEDFEWVY